jgi:hypothetical protein
MESAVQAIVVIFEPEPRLGHCPEGDLPNWRHARSQEDLLVNVLIDWILLRPRRDSNPCSYRPGPRNRSEP